MVTLFAQVAEGYDEKLRFVRLTAARLVERAALQPGEQVLDAGTGTGHAALGAAAVSPGGHVTGVDISAAMLAHARRKAQESGLANVDFREGDAQAPALPDASVHVVVSSSVIFFLPDPLEALRNWRRVLKPGGRVLFSTFGPDNNVPLADILGRHLATYGLQNPSPVSSYLSDTGRCHALLEAAGFTGVTVHTEQLGYYYRNAQEFWEETRHANVRVVLATLPPDQLARFHRDLVTEVAGLATDAGIWRSLQVNFCRGVNRLREE
jgi:ubiquinone/menaquinone biosynthesis C-methylase UbiE